jgi:hypothetical protein
MPNFREMLRDGALLAGIALITTGAAMIYRPAGFITCGVLLLAFAAYDVWAD